MAGIARLTQYQMPHSLRKRVNYNDAGVASGVLVGTVPAGSIITACKVVIDTAFNAGTTNVLQVGTTATGAQIASSTDTASGTAGQKTATALNSLSAVAADTDIWVNYAQTGTAATTGLAYVVVTFHPNNDL